MKRYMNLDKINIQLNIMENITRYNTYDLSFDKNVLRTKTVGRKTLLTNLPRSVTRQINLEIQNTFFVKEVYSTLLFQQHIRH